MGKGANNLLSADLNNLATEPLPKTLISWDEVKKHNTKDNCWIVVNNFVYNVTSFKKNHPGGAKIIEFYAGQDATEVFNAFHKDFDRVFKFAKCYKIGQIDPNDKSNEKLSPDVKEKVEKEIAIRKDFKDVKEAAEKMGLFKPSYTFYFLHGIHIVLFQMLGYYILLNYGSKSWAAVLLALACNVIAEAQAGWAQHDYGHSSMLSKPKHNNYVHLFFMGFIKGASADWWTYMHNMHHAKPNVIEKDPDVRLEPFFVVGTVEPRRRAEKNVKQKKKNYYPFTIQQYLFPIAAPLLFPLLFQWTTIRHAIRRNKYLDLVSMVPMYILHFWVTYATFQSVLKCAVYFFFVRLFESAWFTWVSQCNHIVMDVHDDVDYDSWLHLQIKATCNIEKSWFNDWYTGHLNFQIEHHLFPTMPRHNLYKIQPLVKSLCEKHGVSYVIKPLWRAFYDILLSLKKSGQLWKEAYDELISSL
ncbi:fatty acid desaturase 2 [Brachionus plicatilis]|uniref:Fatty acid desaturase 2 n=1 Tax=Brachionus plicatilis TaxID=10195 RepID=A0A3M7QJD4_BRAPC|nr:fatty acid desaturase 2 [Brachionus plicatilis]